MGCDRWVGWIPRTTDKDREDEVAFVVDGIVRSARFASAADCSALPLLSPDRVEPGLRDKVPAFAFADAASCVAGALVSLNGPGSIACAGEVACPRSVACAEEVACSDVAACSGETACSDEALWSGEALCSDETICPEETVCPLEPADSGREWIVTSFAEVAEAGVEVGLYVLICFLMGLSAVAAVGRFGVGPPMGGLPEGSAFAVEGEPGGWAPECVCEGLNKK
jgi:hypothetical protein